MQDPLRAFGPSTGSGFLTLGQAEGSLWGLGWLARPELWQVGRGDGGRGLGGWRKKTRGRGTGGLLAMAG